MFTKPRKRKYRNTSRQEGIWCPSSFVISWFGFTPIGGLYRKLFLAHDFSRRPTLGWLLFPLFIQQSKQTIEDDSRLLHALAIISKRLTQAIDDRVESGSFEPLKLVIFEINVMYYFAEFAQTLDLAQAESFDDRLKRAVFTMMGELSIEHVER